MQLDLNYVHFICIITVSVILIYDYFNTPFVISTNRKNALKRNLMKNVRILGPYNITSTKMNDDYNRLMDMKQFKFEINSKQCVEYKNGLLLLIMVHSKPNHFDNRIVIRETWGSVADESTKVIFLLGRPYIESVDLDIQDENDEYGDIVQGNFIDTYRNMSYKHVMGLKWAAHHCPAAKYILKVDDDVMVHMFALWELLARELSPWGAENLILCMLLNNKLVHRSGTKWKVLQSEFNSSIYPDYCAGWAVLYSKDVVVRLLEVAQDLPFFWIDDVLITGFGAQKINVNHTQANDIGIDLSQLSDILKKAPNAVKYFIFGPYNLKIEEMRDVWKYIIGERWQIQDYRT